jgi:hypothetical protein
LSALSPRCRRQPAEPVCESLSFPRGQGQRFFAANRGASFHSRQARGGGSSRRHGSRVARRRGPPPGPPRPRAEPRLRRACSDLRTSGRRIMGRMPSPVSDDCRPRPAPCKYSVSGRPLAISTVESHHRESSGRMGFLPRYCIHADKQFGDMRVARIVDCLAAPGDAATVIAEVTRELERRGPVMIVSNQIHASWSNALRSAGFFSAPSNFIFSASKASGGTAHPLGSSRNGRPHQSRRWRWLHSSLSGSKSPFRRRE